MWSNDQKHFFTHVKGANYIEFFSGFPLPLNFWDAVIQTGHFDFQLSAMFNNPFGDQFLFSSGGLWIVPLPSPAANMLQGVKKTLFWPCQTFLAKSRTSRQKRTGPSPGAEVKRWHWSDHGPSSLALPRGFARASTRLRLSRVWNSCAISDFQKYSRYKMQPQNKIGVDVVIVLLEHLRFESECGNPARNKNSNHIIKHV